MCAERSNRELSQNGRRTMKDLFINTTGIAAPAVGLAGLLLIGFLVAHWHRLRVAERRLELLPEADRARSLDNWLVRLRLDAGNLTREQKFELISIELRHRSELALFSARIIGVVVIACLGISAIAFVLEGTSGSVVALL